MQTFGIYKPLKETCAFMLVSEIVFKDLPAGFNFVGYHTKEHFLLLDYSFNIMKYGLH